MTGKQKLILQLVRSARHNWIKWKSSYGDIDDIGAYDAYLRSAYSAALLLFGRELKV